MGFFGSTLILIGMYITGRKNRWGFALGLCGEACWFARGIQTGLYDLLILSTVFAIMHVYNFWQWSGSRKLGNLLFSQRRALTAEIDEWIVKHKAKPGTEAVLAFLAVHNVELPKPRSRTAEDAMTRHHIRVLNLVGPCSILAGAAYCFNSISFAVAGVLALLISIVVTVKGPTLE